jgi:drug/metabolite transporter (DMT)-like permease
LVNVINKLIALPVEDYHPYEVTIERGREMKTYTIIGIILIVIGVVALAYQGITYTSREKVVDIGPIQMTADKTKTIPLPPIVGGIALLGGIVLVVVGGRKS